MSSELHRIIRSKRHEIEQLEPIDSTRLRPSDRDFAAALRGPGRAVIAEMKAAAPSVGVLCQDYDPDAIAQRYERGGAVALSVLTDRRFFNGCPSHLVQARLASSLPVLRKDFILDAVQVQRSRFMGADACLLIVAALDSAGLSELKARAEDLGMDVVIEVHDERELEQAMSLEPRIIGINNRSLDDLSIDLEVTGRLCPQIPPSVIVISESGLSDAAAVQALPPRVDAVLIGTALMRCLDPEAFLRATLGEVESRA